MQHATLFWDATVGIMNGSPVSLRTFWKIAATPERSNPSPLPRDLSLTHNLSFKEARLKFYVHWIAWALEESNGSLSRAAPLLGIAKSTLHEWLKILGLGSREVRTQALRGNYTTRVDEKILLRMLNLPRPELANGTEAI